jgi:hypothetical protein
MGAFSLRGQKTGRQAAPNPKRRQASAFQSGQATIEEDCRYEKENLEASEIQD